MKNLTFSVLFTFYTLLSQAQIFFGSQQVITQNAVSRTETLFAADLDGDGYQDLLTSNDGDQSIAWFRNVAGSGSFSGPVKLATDASQPAAAIAFDADGDGDKDIVYASWEKSQIYLLLNRDGLGDFGQQKIIDSNASGVWSLHHADLDGDGDIDLVSALREGNSIVWYENLDGKANYSAKKMIDDQMVNAREGFPADINGDSFADVVSLDWFTGEIAWYQNVNGQGNFSPRKQITENLIYPDKLICADMDGNGSIDIVVKSNSTVLWIKNLGNQGSFGLPLQIDQNEQIADFSITDFNGDNLMDILVTTTYGKISWYMNNGQGTFSHLKPIDNSVDGNNLVLAADLDGDSDKDIIASDYTKSLISWYENTNGLGATGLAKTINKPELTGPADLKVFDADGNGKDDLFVASKTDDAIYIFEKNQRTNNYTPARKIADVDSPTSVCLSDLDRDGKADIVTCAEQTGKISWSKNLGNNQFNMAEIIADFSTGASCIFSADLDKDGDNDILVTSIWANRLSWFENNGAGIFSQEKMISDQLAGATDISIADIDKNGLPDILVASKYSRISFFLNQGNKIFSQEIIIDTNMNGVEKIWALDMDGDGDPDVLSHDFSRIVWYENTGRNDRFAPTNVINHNTYLPNISYVYPFDADKDGDMDVFATWGQHGQIEWFSNDGAAASFTHQKISAHNLNEPSTLASGDINNDGYKDLISTSFKDNIIAWYAAEPVPDFTTQPEDVGICDKGQFYMTAEMQNATFYKWQMANPYTQTYQQLENNDMFQGVDQPMLSVMVDNPYLDQAHLRCMVGYKGTFFISREALLTIDTPIPCETGSPIVSCLDAVQLNGCQPEPGTGYWSALSGNLAIENPASPYLWLTNLVPGNYLLEWKITNGACVTSANYLVEIKEPSVITEQTPFLNLNPGSNAVLTVLAEGSDNTFQWYKDGQEVIDRNRITGARTNQLTILSVIPEDQGNYYCLVEGYCNSLQSNNISLTVLTFLDDPGNLPVRVYPNPVKEMLNIQSELCISKARIFRSTGEEVLSIETDSCLDQLDISHLLPGIFITAIFDGVRWRFNKINKIDSGR